MESDGRVEVPPAGHSIPSEQPMNRILPALALGAGTLVPQTTAQVPAPSKLDARVLYAGVPGAPRTGEFVAFLSQHFAKVGSTDYSQFRAEEADGYDVVIFDAKPNPTARSIGLPSAPSLPADFRRASVLISGAGINAFRKQKLKLDWL